MNTNVLLVTAMSISLCPFGYAAADKGGQKNQSVEFCSSSYEYESGEYDELRIACFHLIEDSGNNQTDVTTSERCVLNIGTCDTSEFRTYCQTDNPGPGAILVVSKNQILVDLRPEDCDFAVDFNGASFSAIANGTVRERIDYGSHFWHYSDPETNRQCTRISKNGTLENRSADVDLSISGTQILGQAYIRTSSAGSLVETCPEE